MARKERDLPNLFAQSEVEPTVEERKKMSPTERSIWEAKNNRKAGTVEERSKRTTFLLENELQDRIKAVIDASGATKQQIINDAIREVLPEWEAEFDIETK